MTRAIGRGRLTSADHARIEELHGKGLSAGRIAQLLERHPATVAWHMYSAGMKAPRKSSDKPVSYLRGGRVVRHFSAEEDVFIEALRIQAFTFREIAEHVNKRFRTERSPHTVQCRLIMLSARETA